MRWRSLGAGLAFSLLAAPALAGPLCTSTTQWTHFATQGVGKFEGNFEAAGSYVDCFTFTPVGTIDGFGHASDFDVPNNKLDIELTRIELYRGADLIATDLSPKHFDFGNLEPGQTYTFAVYSDVSSTTGRLDRAVAYKGSVEAIPQQVPEPGILALVGIALIAAAIVALRRSRPAVPASQTPADSA